MAFIPIFILRLYLLIENLERIAFNGENQFSDDWIRLRILTIIGCTASAVALTLSLIFFTNQIIYNKVCWI